MEEIPNQEKNSLILEEHQDKQPANECPKA